MRYLKAEDLTLEQKLGMVLCARRWDTEDDIEFSLELIKNRALGSVQIPFNSRTEELIRRIKETADYPILIINDMERGYPRCDLPKIANLTLSACATEKHYRAFARGIVKYAKADGFSGTWCPIVDILRVNKVCGVTRVFGDTAEKVTSAAEIIANEFIKSGFFATGKHFPGGADKPYDGHMVDTPSDLTEEELINVDVAPYVELHKKGLLSAIMTRHCTYSKIDPDYPATLSKKILSIIRDKGFDGVIFTDSLAMMGILQKYGEENAYGLAINAGVDNILTNYRTPTRKCYEMIKNCFERGMFSEERLNDAVRHVLTLQQWVDERKDIEPEFTEEDRALLESVTKDCITAICDEGLSADIGDPDKRRLFVVITKMPKGNSEISMEINDDGWYKPLTLAEHIKANFKNSEVTFIPEFSNQMQNEQLLVKATEFDEVVFVTFAEMNCYLGTDCLTRRTEALIDCLNIPGKVSAVVHFGNPHALENVTHLKRAIFGFNSTASQKYAIDVLAGKIEAKGKMPINIKLK